MSVPVIDPPVTAPSMPAVAPPQPASGHMPIFIDEEALIPEWVVDQDTFRVWARSNAFPTKGRYSFLDGMLWVDRTMEEFFSHNQVKTRYTRVLDQVVADMKQGYFVSDGFLWTHPAIGISTITDALYFTYDALTSGRVRLIQGATRGYMEVEGTPDMTLEIISDSSVKKDTQVLFEKCAKAGVREYWLVDARGREPVFDIWCLQDGAYQSAASEDGWLTSVVFGNAFKLLKDKDPLGHPCFQLLIR